MTREKKTPGFTIVELLIVIVVIAVLAAIAIVSYQGIQRRATNTAIISAAQQTYKILQLYTTQYGVYPTAGWRSVCLTFESGCRGSNGPVDTQSSSVHTEVANRLAEFGTVPQSMPSSGEIRRGIMFEYDPIRQVNGEPHRGVMLYYLQGAEQNCGMDRVLNVWSGETTWSTTGYTVANSTDGVLSPDNGAVSGSTGCVVSVPL